MSALLHLLAKDRLGARELDRMYLAFRDSSTFVADALQAARQLDPAPAANAVWLLRRAAQDQRLREPDMLQLAARADELTHWVARLCLCQLFAETPCPEGGREALYPFLLDCCDDRRVIVRAWAVSALSHFAPDPRYAPEVAARLREARADPAPSMQARLRHLTNELRARGQDQRHVNPAPRASAENGTAG